MIPIRRDSPRFDPVEMCGEGGFLRLDARDWAAAILSAYSCEWLEFTPMGKLFWEAVMVIADPRVTSMARELAQNDRRIMTKTNRHRYRGRPIPSLTADEAHDLARVLREVLDETKRTEKRNTARIRPPRYCFDYDSFLAWSEPIEWHAANKIEVLEQLIEFSEQGEFDIWHGPLDGI